MTATMWIGQWMCYHVQKEEMKRDWWMIFMQTISSVFNLLTSLLLGKKLHLLIHEYNNITNFLVTITYNACTNMTTNEQLNWRRYDYLKNQMGQFSNPFNRGTKQNLKEFFHLQRSVEEVTNPESLMSV